MKSGTERTTDWREKLKAAGWRQKSFLLSPDALKGLAALGRQFGTETKAVESILAAAAPPRRTAKRKEDKAEGQK